MSITAELEDGRQLEFPDGTDTAVIQQTVKRMVTPEPSPFKRGLTTLAETAAPLSQVVPNLLQADEQAAQKLWGYTPEQMGQDVLEKTQPYLGETGGALAATGMHMARELATPLNLAISAGVPFLSGATRALRAAPRPPVPVAQAAPLAAPIAEEIAQVPIIPTRPKPIPMQEFQAPPMKPDVAPPTIEAVPELPKYAGSVNLERLTTPESVKQVILQASKDIPQSPSITVDGIVQAAQEMGGLTLEDAVKLGRSGSVDTVKIYQARQVHAALAKEADATRQAYLADNSSKNLEAWRNSWQKELAAFEAAQSVARKWGQAGAAFKAQAEGNVVDNARIAVNRALQEMKTKGRFSDEAERYLAGVDFQDPQSVIKFLRYAGTKTATWRQKIFEGWLAATLSAPITHAVNMTSNALFLAYRPVERMMAAAIQLPEGAARQRFFGEAVADYYGMSQGIKDGARAFVQSLNTGISKTGGTKFDIAKTPSIEGAKGELIRKPLYLLTAADDFFKTIAVRGDLYAQAYRQVAKDGAMGKNRATSIAELANNPTPKMLEHARTDALYRTFQQELGTAGKHFLALREELPGSEYIVPFITTPVNITKAALERTPLNVGRVLYKMHTGQLKGGELADEASRAITGSLLGGTMALYAAEGQITGGGPKDPELRKALLNTGWQPYSVKVGDKWYSYQRLEPLGTVLAMAADFAEIAKVSNETERKKMASRITAAIATNITNKTFLAGLTDMVNAFSDPVRYGDRWANRLVASPVPSAVAAYARSEDPNFRDVQTMTDAIKARIPGQSETILPKRDVFGEALPRPGDFWSRFLSPVQVSEYNADPVRQKVVDLQLEISPIKRNLSLGGEKLGLAKLPKEVELSPEQYDAIQVQAGQQAYKLVSNLVANPSFNNQPAEVQRYAIKNMIELAREGARVTMRANLIKGGALQRKPE